MKNLLFTLPYHTQWGEQVEVVCSLDGEAAQRIVMQTPNGEIWQASLQVPDDARHIRHAYLISDAATGTILRAEPDNWRFFTFNHRSAVTFADCWTEEGLPALYHHSAFRDCIMLPRGGEKLHMKILSEPCLLLLHALPPQEGRRWAVVGNTPEWGAWDVAKARPMQRTGTFEWALPLSRRDFSEGIYYKYVLLSEDPQLPPLWESGNDRRLVPLSEMCDTGSLVHTDNQPRLEIPPLRLTGCVIPVFSLRSEGSWGCGDFGDLETLIRWTAENGMHAVQILPINDTTRTGSWQDSYPYSAISVFALHPNYLDPRPWSRSQAFQRHAEEGHRLNLEDALDYEGTFRLKIAFLRDLFAEIGTRTLRSNAFKEYASAQADWLEPYVEFCAMRDTFHTADFRQWPHAEKLTEKQKEGIDKEKVFWRFVQFLLHTQLTHAHDEARQLGVILKGDIPIGISPDSVPARTEPHLFRFTGSAGAPPDFFSRNGQNWGFPTYRWDVMAADNYAWWKRRMDHMSLHFDAYRIDHVLGIFRIWAIPSNQIDGTLGRFRPALPFSRNELKECGFHADPLALSAPSVSAEEWEDMCNAIGRNAAELRQNFLEETAGGRLTLQPSFRTQQDILRRVADGVLARLLCDLATHVLFIADPETPDTFHPRILGFETSLFQTLSESDKEAFYRLHDDFFHRRHNELWEQEAMRKLPVIIRSGSHSADGLPTLYPLESTGPLPCAEDLGMVPSCVRGVLRQLQILTLEIERCPKESGVRFAPPADFPWLSVATLGTHDMSPLRLWWETCPEDAKAYWTDVLHRPVEAFPEHLGAADCEAILAHTLRAPSLLRLIALQDLFAISDDTRRTDTSAELINDPSNSTHYWRYRMHLTLERLFSSVSFNEKLHSLIRREA